VFGKSTHADLVTHDIGNMIGYAYAAQIDASLPEAAAGRPRANLSRSLFYQLSG
jgi:hypothetical protein